MTEKRFTIIETQIGKLIHDNQTDMNTGDVCIITDLLNELHEEKEYWKERYKQELEKNSIMTIAYDKQGNAHILPKRAD